MRTNSEFFYVDTRLNDIFVSRAGAALFWYRYAPDITGSNSITTKEVG